MTKKKDPSALLKRGRPPKSSTPPGATPSKPAPSSTPSPNVSPVSSNPLSDLAKRVLAERAGDPARAQTPGGKKAASTGTATDTPKKKKEITPVDPDIAKALAGVMADSEAEAAAMAVPAEHAEKTRANVSRILKFGWEFYFVREGVDMFPGWAVLLIAHIGAAAATIRPNMEGISKWFDEVRGKVKTPPKVYDEKKPEAPHHKEDKATQKPPLVTTTPDGDPIKAPEKERIL